MDLQIVKMFIFLDIWTIIKMVLLHELLYSFLFLSCDEGDGDALVTHVELGPAIILNTEWGLVILGHDTVWTYLLSGLHDDVTHNFVFRASLQVSFLFFNFYV